MVEGRLTRKEQQACTRSRLLSAAAAVFARRGLRGASIDEVAAEGGYTKGAVYANFASKEELFLAMLDQRFQARLEQVERLAGTDELVSEQARAAGEDFARYLSQDPDWQRLFFEAAVTAAREEPFRLALVARYRMLREGIEVVLARRISELDVRPPVDAGELATMTFAMANGFALERLLEPQAAPEELYGTMLAIFFEGLRSLSEKRAAASDPATSR